MRGDFFDYDPLTGVVEHYEEQWVDGKLVGHIHSYQDVEPLLDAAKRIANSGTVDEAWTKQGVATYATIPAVVIHQMLKKGIKFFDPNDIGAVVREVNTNYPYLKLTHKHHEI